MSKVAQNVSLDSKVSQTLEYTVLYTLYMCVHALNNSSILLEQKSALGKSNSSNDTEQAHLRAFTVEQQENLH